MTPNRRQAIVWINDGLVYVSLHLDELNFIMLNLFLEA